MEKRESEINNRVIRIGFIGDYAYWFKYPYLAKALVWKLIAHYVEQGNVEIAYRRRKAPSVELWIEELCRQTWIRNKEIEIGVHESSFNIFLLMVEKLIKNVNFMVFVFGDKKRERNDYLKYEIWCDEHYIPYHVYRVYDNCKSIRLAYQFLEPSLKPLEHFTIKGIMAHSFMSEIRHSLRSRLNRKAYKPPPLL